MQSFWPVTLAVAALLTVSSAALGQEDAAHVGDEQLVDDHADAGNTVWRVTGAQP